MSAPPEYTQAQALYSIPGVMNVGWDGQYIVVVVSQESVRTSIPAYYGRVPVRAVVSGPLKSF